MNPEKTKYQEFISKFESSSIFSQPWWLDIVCGSANWNIVIAERDGKAIASLRYYTKRRMFLKIITQPPLTQTIQPLFDERFSSNFDKKAKITSELIRKIPVTSKFQMNLHADFTNWLPFYWQGYSQTTFYSFILESGISVDSIWENMSGKRRTEIRKSENSEVFINDKGSFSTFFKLYQSTFIRKKRKPPFKKPFLENLVNSCLEKKVGKMLFAVDKKGVPLSCAFFVWDDKRTYYLLGGLNSEVDTKGAQSLLLWQAIKTSLESSRDFDFEGSMDKGVGNFFSSYGADLVPYFGISK